MIENIILIALGFVIMLGAIILYGRLSRSMQLVTERLDGFSIFLFRTYIVLMLFFLLGYGYFGYLLYYNIEYDFILLISLIFFFGAIFVFIGMVVQLRLTRCIFNSNAEMINTLIGAVEARDVNLKGHSHHVMLLSMLIYDRMNKQMRGELNRQKLEYAAILHDLGKMGIPENILNKPAKLNDEEWQIIKQHPQIGVDILSKIKGMTEIQNYVKYHHERLDGLGYYGVRSNEIPLASKIICIADAYSAMVMKRSYKNALSHQTALSNLLSGKSTQFDAYLLSVFESVPEEELEDIMFRVRSNAGSRKKRHHNLY